MRRIYTSFNINLQRFGHSPLQQVIAAVRGRPHKCSCGRPVDHDRVVDRASPRGTAQRLFFFGRRRQEIQRPFLAEACIFREFPEVIFFPRFGVAL